MSTHWVTRAEPGHERAMLVPSKVSLSLAVRFSTLRDQAPKVLFELFPRIFKLASWLSATAVTTGLILASERYLDNPSVLWTTSSGLLFSFGATIGILLTAFHFILEPRLDGMICTAAKADDVELSDRVLRLLRIIPRVGLVVITTTLWTMMVGARGL